MPVETSGGVLSVVGTGTVLTTIKSKALLLIGKESVPVQLAECRFPGLSICNAKMFIYF